MSGSEKKVNEKTYDISSIKRVTKGLFTWSRADRVGDHGLVGLVSFVFTLLGTQNKRNLPH